MSTVGEIPSWRGFRVEDADGVPLGRVDGLTVARTPDGRTAGRALQVRCSDGSRLSVPLAGARRRAGAVRVAVTGVVTAQRGHAPIPS